VWAKEHHLSKAAEGFAAKLAPRYDGPYQVVDFVSPVNCKIRHTQSKKLGVSPKRKSSIRHTESTIKDMDKDLTLIQTARRKD